jgi:hypothetical protein
MGMKTTRVFLALTALFLAGVALAGNLSTTKLGGVVDQAQAWTSTSPYYLEVGDGGWRCAITPAVPGKVEITTSVHARAGLGTGYVRLVNKLRVVRPETTNVSRIETLAINSEALIEFFTNLGLRFFDASRTWNVVDEAPVVGETNYYAVELQAYDGVRSEVSYGSTLTCKFWPD